MPILSIDWRGFHNNGSFLLKSRKDHLAGAGLSWIIYLTSGYKSPWVKHPKSIGSICILQASRSFAVNKPIYADGKDHKGHQNDRQFLFF